MERVRDGKGAERERKEREGIRECGRVMEFRGDLGKGTGRKMARARD